MRTGMGDRSLIALSMGFSAGAMPSDQVMIEHICKVTGWKKPAKAAKKQFFAEYLKHARGEPIERAIIQSMETKEEKRIKKKTPKGDEFYSSPAWRHLRYKALKMYGARCQCCGITSADGGQIHVDHIKPRSTHPSLQLQLSNLQILCADCNLGKGAWDDTDWRAEAERHMKDILTN